MVDTVQVVQEIPQLVRPMGPDDEGVVHVAKPAEELVRGQVNYPLLKVLHVEVGNDRREWRVHGHTVNLFVELAIETEV
jgi:hypothetical protein